MLKAGGPHSKNEARRFFGRVGMPDASGVMTQKLKHPGLRFGSAGAKNAKKLRPGHLHAGGSPGQGLRNTAALPASNERAVLRIEHKRRRSNLCEHDLGLGFIYFHGTGGNVADKRSPSLSEPTSSTRIGCFKNEVLKPLRHAVEQLEGGITPQSLSEQRHVRICPRRLFNPT